MSWERTVPRRIREEESLIRIGLVVFSASSSGLPVSTIWGGELFEARTIELMEMIAARVMPISEMISFFIISLSKLTSSVGGHWSLV